MAAKSGAKRSSSTGKLVKKTIKTVKVAKNIKVAKPKTTTGKLARPSVSSTGSKKTSKPLKKPLGVNEPMSENTVANPLKATTAQTLLSYGVQPYSSTTSEAYMSDVQLAHFRNLLNVWKNALLQGGDETIHDLKESAEVPADISDQATQEETFALKLRTRDRERKLIKKIDEAIQLIDNKEYGFCEECGVEIGIRRLEARPTATLCIDCKTLDEVREKHGR